MKLSLVLYATYVSRTFAWHDVQHKPVRRDVRNGSYIVELVPGASSSFHAHAKRSFAYTVRTEFNSTNLFYGVSLDLDDSVDIETLKSLDGVKNVFPNRSVPPIGYGRYPVSNYTRAVTPHFKRDTVTVTGGTGDFDPLSQLKMSGVDHLHNRGLKGKGAKVGIIDSGVDYRHPALGGGFGPGFKIAGGWDFVGDDFTGSNDVEDSDPLVTCMEGGHGTHVTGIIGAQDPRPGKSSWGLSGVAPEASLYMYRVFGCNSNTYDDIVMNAMIKAVEDGVDLITMSLGATQGWELLNPFETLIANIHSSGVAVFAALGNAGYSGPYSSSSPAISQNAISVGSVEGVKFPMAYRAEGSGSEKIAYASRLPVQDKGVFHVVQIPASSGGSCSLLATPAWKEAAVKYADDLGHVIMMFPYESGCLDYYFFAADNTNIRHVFLITPDDEDIDIIPPGYQDSIFDMQIRQSEADKIINAMSVAASNNKEFTIQFPDKKVYELSQPAGRTMSGYSTFGPSIELTPKPQLSAPGGGIISTWVASDGIGYGAVSGTSMATPFAAGCYALIKARYTELGPQEIRELLQSTAQPVSLYEQSMLTTTAQQGSGLIQCDKALDAYTGTIVTPSEFNLGDSVSPKTQVFTIKNRSGATRKYKIGHQAAAEVEALPRISEYYLYWAANNHEYYATTNFSQTEVTVARGKSIDIAFTVQAPTGMEPHTQPIYSGFITITSDSDDKDVFTIPYTGLPYSRMDAGLIDTSNFYKKLKLLDPQPPSGVPVMPFISTWRSGVRDNSILEFDPSYATGNQVFINYDIGQKTPYVRFDWVPVDTPFVPRKYGFDPTADLPTINPPALPPQEEVFGVAGYGMSLCLALYGIDWTQYPLCPQQFYPTVSSHQGVLEVRYTGFANGSYYQLLNGDYRVLVRALLPGADPEKLESWDSWLSPVARINKTGP